MTPALSPYTGVKCSQDLISELEAHTKLGIDRVLFSAGCELAVIGDAECGIFGNGMTGAIATRVCFAV